MFFFIAVLLGTVTPVLSIANGITVSNVSLTGQHKSQHYVDVQFNLKWRNSWRTSTLESNWDAAWVFIKFKSEYQSEWHHATINYVDGQAQDDGHYAPAGCTINTSSDGKGVFIYSSTDHIGNVDYPQIRLRWDYGTDGIADNDSATVCVYAIEMVYVPQGSFYVGNSSYGMLAGEFQKGTSGAPYQINSENQITLGGSNAASLNGSDENGMSVADDFNDTSTQTLPAAFPKGFNSFYCMKYEITQGQYTDFLNKLTQNQAITRYPAKNGDNRYTISGSWPGYITATPDRPCNWLSWEDACAYADWAGLRPMTELEYEKACRGSQTPSNNEFAWGDTSIVQATGIEGDSTDIETANNTGANAVYGDNPYVTGPIRAGWTQGSSRETTGDTYYGINDMSGNLWEQVISIGSSTGRNFTGDNGNGALDTYGNADVASWPGSNGTGSGLRGGSWFSSKDFLRVADRDSINSGASIRKADMGFRAVRTAP